MCCYLPCWISKYKGSFGVFCYKINFALPIVNFPQYYVVVFFRLKLFSFPLIFIEHRNSTNWKTQTHTHTHTHSELLSPLVTFQSHTLGPYTHIVHLLQMGTTKKDISVDQGPTNIPSFSLSKKKIPAMELGKNFSTLFVNCKKPKRRIPIPVLLSFPFLQILTNQTDCKILNQVCNFQFQHKLTAATFFFFFFFFFFCCGFFFSPLCVCVCVCNISLSSCLLGERRKTVF